MPSYHVQRSIQIDATPDKVFEVVSDYGSWTTWSPWLCAEPEAEVKVSEDASSVGSLYSWNGEIVGQGEIEHQKLQPGKLIEDEIRFIKPFKSVSNVAFDFEPAGEGTKITWHMRGTLPWFLFWMRPQMEIFIGMDYERGLKMLKEWIETGDVASETKIRGVEPVGPIHVVGVRKQCAVRDVGPSMDAAFTSATDKLTAQGVSTDGEKISVYHAFDMKSQTFDYTSGYVVPEIPPNLPADLSTWSLPSSQALCVDHVGSYSNLGNGWSAANQHARYKKLKQSRVGTYEIYKNDPADTPPAELHTQIFLPLKG